MSSAFLSIKPFCVTRHLGWKSVERQSCEQNGLFAADFWIALHVKWARVARTGPRAGTRTSLSIHGTDDCIECRHASKALPVQSLAKVKNWALTSATVHQRICPSQYGQLCIFFRNIITNIKVFLNRLGILMSREDQNGRRHIKRLCIIRGMSGLPHPARVSW